MSVGTYACTILRYIHDPSTGEFVNVGLVLTMESRSYGGSLFRSQTQRITQFFPGVKGRNLRRTLSAIKASAKRAEKQMDRVWSSCGTGEDAGNAARASECVLAFAQRILVNDDSALQWSEPFTGVTSTPAETLTRLYERLIVRYDQGKGHPQRSDDQVWRVFSKALEIRNLGGRIEEHEVDAKLERVQFRHALKNGKWHLLEPISFDLLNPDSITDKAKRILGQMTLLEKANQDFKLHLLIGEPSDAAVRPAYEIALRILEEVPVAKRIYPESNVADFGIEMSRIAAEAG
jgi:hypothetical protein